MLFPFMHQGNSRKYIPQGLKAKKLARLMSGLKPGPTQLGVFPQALHPPAMHTQWNAPSTAACDSRATPFEGQREESSMARLGYSSGHCHHRRLGQGKRNALSRTLNEYHFGIDCGPKIFAFRQAKRAAMPASRNLRDRSPPMSQTWPSPR